MINLYDYNNDFIDQSIVIYYKNPYSFTGEDVIEFQCHGGIVVAEIIMQTVIHYGARLANPGEFTKRAVLNGKMDLTKAEAAARLIESKSVDAAKILAKQLKGDLSKYIDTLRDSLVEILAFIEVNIDYAEEDLPQDLQEQIKNKLSEIYILIDKSVKLSKSRQGLLNGFKVSIIGKPNVGKSSLLNSLLSYDRAIISNIAGTTRDTIEESLKIGTHLIKIVDTAGIREANDDIEKIGIQRSIASIEDSEIVIALFDNSVKIDNEDKKIISLLKKYKNEKEIIVAINKSDLETAIDEDKLKEFNPVKISCNSDTSLIISKLSSYLDKQSIQDDLLLISARQIKASEDTLKAIFDAKENLETGELELLAFNINEAIESISSITKPFEREEILDKMFGSFCLGK